MQLTRNSPVFSHDFWCGSWLWGRAFFIANTAITELHRFKSPKKQLFRFAVRSFGMIPYFRPSCGVDERFAFCIDCYCFKEKSQEILKKTSIDHKSLQI